MIDSCEVNTTGFPCRSWPKMITFVLSLALTVSACQTGNDRDSSDETIEEHGIPFRDDGSLTISRNGNVYLSIRMEIADNDSLRARGMMERRSTPEDTGMLFIFDFEEDREFWMANTPLSLDLLFVNADSIVISIKKYLPPLSPQQVPSNGPARFVLEVIAGYSDTMGIIEGDKLSWTRGEQE
ncbi:MAG: DUF192 domain-containing protein [Bacteroidetes bacterium]|nr:MAG: DUF192 domain-containing protein [Bacteroidota bacterium]